MIKAVFFDFFGVLYPDTLWGLADVFIPHRSTEQKQKLSDIVSRSDLGHISREEFWHEASAVYGVSIEQVFEEKDKLGSIDRRLLDYIYQLKSAGLKTGVISNIGVGFMDNVLSAEEQNKYFDSIVVSGEVGFIKPDQRIFTYASEQVSLPLDVCLFFDDIQRNVDGAIAAGMQAYLYEGIESSKSVLER